VTPCSFTASEKINAGLLSTFLEKTALSSRSRLGGHGIERNPAKPLTRAAVSIEEDVFAKRDYDENDNESANRVPHPIPHIQPLCIMCLSHSHVSGDGRDCRAHNCPRQP
jgi:hypothetical protein